MSDAQRTIAKLAAALKKLKSQNAAQKVELDEAKGKISRLAIALQRIHTKSMADGRHSG